MRIRSGKKTVGGPRSKKALEYPIYSPNVSTRKKRTRTQTPDDTVGSFSPIVDDPYFDDIEPELEPESLPVLEPVPEHQPEEPTLPPLSQARRLRMEPSIQVIEPPIEDTSDSNEACFRALCTLCEQARWFLTSAASQCSVHALLSSQSNAAATGTRSSWTKHFKP